MTSGTDAKMGTEDQRTPDVSQWWQTVTPHAISDSSRVVNAFIEGLQRRSAPPEGNESFEVARALAIKLLMDDAQPLETLLAAGQSAEGVLRVRLRATEDPRRDTSFESAQQTANSLMPVLSACADMLPSSTAARLQQGTSELAEALRKVLFDVSLLAFKFGPDKPLILSKVIRP